MFCYLTIEHALNAKKPFLEPQAWLECLYQWGWLFYPHDAERLLPNSGKLLLHLVEDIFFVLLTILIRDAGLWPGWGLVYSFISLSKIEQAKQTQFFMPFSFDLSVFCPCMGTPVTASPSWQSIGWRWKISTVTVCFLCLSLNKRHMGTAELFFLFAFIGQK